MSIAERLIKLRGSRTQTEVGLAIWPDIDIRAAQQRMSRYERLRDDAFRYEDLRILANYYGVSIAHILDIRGGVEKSNITPEIKERLEKVFLELNEFEGLEWSYKETLESGLRYITSIGERGMVLKQILDRLNHIEKLLKNDTRFKKIKEVPKHDDPAVNAVNRNH